MISVQVAVGKALEFYESLPSKGKPSELLVDNTIRTELGNSRERDYIRLSIFLG